VPDLPELPQIALDPRAERELKRYVHRGKVIAATSSLAFLILVAIVPAFSLSLFERLFAPVGGTLSVVIGTGVGTLFRARTERTILSKTEWHEHACHYEPPNFGISPTIVVHGRGTYPLRTTALWRIGSGGIAQTSRIDVAEGEAVGELAVLRVPGHDALFLASRPPFQTDNSRRHTEEHPRFSGHLR
jgi:hypothetical protein